MKVLKKIQKTEQITDFVVCNMCNEKSRENVEHASLQMIINQDSDQFFLDEYCLGDLISFDICQSCLIELIKKMKLPTGDVF